MLGIGIVPKWLKDMLLSQEVHNNEQLIYWLGAFLGTAQAVHLELPWFLTIARFRVLFFDNFFHFSLFFQ